MSKGLGHIERAILAGVAATHDTTAVWSTDDFGQALHGWVTGYKAPSQHSERKALVRAMHSVVRKYPRHFTLIRHAGHCDCSN